MNHSISNLDLNSQQNSLQLKHNEEDLISVDNYSDNNLENNVGNNSDNNTNDSIIKEEIIKLHSIHDLVSNNFRVPINNK